MGTERSKQLIIGSVMLLVIGIIIVFLSGCSEAEMRATALSGAKKWLEKNHVEGTVSCKHPNEYICDVIPKDARPVIQLKCWKDDCYVLLP